MNRSPWLFSLALLVSMSLLGLPRVSRTAAPPAAAPADNGPHLTLGEAVDRWTRAIGGAAAARGIRSVHLRGERTDSDVHGLMETWIAGDGFRQVVHEGADWSEIVRRGPKVWSQDWNKQVEEVAGRDLADRLADAEIAELLFAGGVGRGLASSRPRLLGRDEAQRIGIRCAPPGALPFDVFLDPATFLPARIVRRVMDDTVTVEMSDWRLVGAVRVPFSITESDGRHTPGHVAITAVDWNQPTDAAWFVRPPDGPSDVRFASGHEARGVPFNFENDHLMLECSVNGRPPVWFMLDSGADATVIHRARLAEFGLEPFGKTSTSGGGGSTDYAFTRVGRLTVGGVTLSGQRAGVIDVTGLEKIYGMRLGGLLGYDFLSRFVVVVHYESHTMDFLAPASYTYRGRGMKLPFVIEDGVPHVRGAIRVPGAAAIPTDFIIDSGAADNVNLTSPFVRANHLLERARRRPAGAPNTLPGSEKEFFAQTSVRGKLQALTLGSFTLSNVPTNLMVAPGGAYGSASFSGTVGEGVLRRFTTIYDYSRRVLILEPNEAYGQPFAARRTFGVSLLSEGPDFTTFTVTGVRKGSPADSSGLRKGDVVTSVDGRPASELSLTELRRRLSEDGGHMTLGVRREGATLTPLVVTVRLQSLDDN